MPACFSSASKENGKIATNGTAAKPKWKNKAKNDEVEEEEEEDNGEVLVEEIEKDSSRSRKRRRPGWLRDNVTDFEELRKTCPFCDKLFKDDKRVAMHVRNVHRKPFKCDLCRRQYYKRERLEAHRASHRTNGGSSHFECNVCHLKFRREETLQAHYVRVHLDVEAKYCCDHCGKRYKLKQDLMLHINQVHMSQLEICRFCGKSVKNVKAHEWRHQNKLIEEAAAANSAGEAAYGIESGTSNPSIFSCKLCYRKFRSESKLENHLMRHVQRYRCDKCDETFQGPSQLMNHKAKHRPGTNCFFCQRYFSSRSNYYQHVLMHARIKPYKCDVCGENYSQRSTLVRHRKCHPIPPLNGAKQVPIAELAKRVLKSFANMTPSEIKEKIDELSYED